MPRGSPLPLARREAAFYGGLPAGHLPEVRVKLNCTLILAVSVR